MRLDQGIKASLAALGLLALTACHNDDDSTAPAPPPPAPPAATYTVGGTLSGLDGSITLANNGGDPRTLTANGAFTFTTASPTGTAYNVTVTSQPANQTCAVTGGVGTIASGNVAGVAVNCETYRITGEIGPGGGTLVGPDGVQVVIPAGALSESTTIGIARSPGGWPEPLIAEATRFGSIYEITPHGVLFDKPVLIRLPAPAGASDVHALASSFDNGWQYTDVAYEGTHADISRNTFSWYYIVDACAPPANDPYPCSYPRGHSYATATPATAISMLTGVPAQPSVGGFYFQSSAGTWEVDSTQLQTLHITMEYKAAPDCDGAHLQLKRVVDGAMQVVSDTTVAIDGHEGTGSATLHVPASELSPGNNTYSMRFACSRMGRAEIGGGDTITFLVTANPMHGFTVDGTITGLDAPGLRLQNHNREIVDVPEGADGFAFGTSFAAGARYDVRVISQPTGQVCTVANGIGEVAADVGDIEVTCQSTVPTPISVALVPGTEMNGLAILSRSTVSGRLLPIGSVRTGDYPRAVVITPDGRFAYTANASGNTVSSFRIDGTSLTSISGSNPATTNPYALTVDPNGQFLRVTNYSVSTLTSFRISTEGVLTSLGSVPVGQYPHTVVTHPNGRFVYTANEVGSSSSGPSLSMFSVNPSTGELTSLGQPLSSPVMAPRNIAIAPNGGYAYVVGALGQVGRVAIDTTTGALTSAGAMFISSATHSESVAIHPDGGFLYVTAENSTGGFIQMYSIGANGALTAASRTPAGGGSNYAAMDSAGDFLYVTNQSDGTVVSYRIDRSTGALTLLESDWVDRYPQGVAVTL